MKQILLILSLLWSHCINAQGVVYESYTQIKQTLDSVTQVNDTSVITMQFTTATRIVQINCAHQKQCFEVYGDPVHTYMNAVGVFTALYKGFDVRGKPVLMELVYSGNSLKQLTMIGQHVVILFIIEPVNSTYTKWESFLWC